MAERILIVDDDPHVLKALERVLRRERYEILKAESGERALALLENYEVATIICDYNMPELTGADVLERVREINPKTGRIILTGVQDLNTVVEAINKGQVSYFILKPWEEISLIQTVRTAVEQFKLIRRNEKLEKENALQHEKLLVSHQTLNRELLIGARIYEKLLVGETPQKIPGFEIEAVAIPSKEIDGDFRTIYQPQMDCLDVLTGDVMGKGLPAALVATAVKMHFMRYVTVDSNQKVFQKDKGWNKEAPSLSQVLHRVQKELADPLLDIGFFATLFFGRFDLKRQRFFYVDCGSPKPIHFCKESGSVRLIEGENLPLGVVKEENYQESSCDILPGDFLLFYSDGVTEARNGEGELFGVKRLMQIIKANAQIPPKALVHIIQRSVLDYSNSDTFDDDLTLIVVKLDPTYTPEVDKVVEASFAKNLSQLEAVRDFVAKGCQALPGDEERITIELQLAVNEAFTNIVKHGGDGKAGDAIVVRIDRQSVGLMIEIRDQGEPFQPEEIAHPDLSGGQDSGFGLYMIEEIADKVVYCQKQNREDWNSLKIFKNFKEGGQMNFTHQREQQVLIVNLEGENLDAKEAPLFKEKITELVAEEHVDNIVFNLKDLQFIDSSGLGSFLSVLRYLNNRGGDLKLACMTKPIRTMFEVVRMHKLFEIFNNTDDAVRSFSNSKG